MPATYVFPFQEVQQTFSSYLRCPEECPAPTDVALTRMALYRELFSNNIESFIEAGFPVLHEVMSKAHWKKLVSDFFARHHCKTPFFIGIAEEFLDYLQHERGAQTDDPPFLLELAHYEWVELALDMSELDMSEVAFASMHFLTKETLLIQPLRLSPLAWPLVYRFPVHQISIGYQPQKASDNLTFIVVYRDIEDKVRFLEINAATYHLLKSFEGPGSTTGMEVLNNLPVELGHLDHVALHTFGTACLDELVTRGILFPVVEPSVRCNTSFYYNMVSDG